MKKSTAFLAALALLLPCLSVHAQEQDDKQIFNHMGAGLTVGLDGVGLEVAAPLTPYLQLRGGYSFFPYTYKNVFHIKKFVVNDGTVVDLTDLPISATAWKGGVGKVLVDIFPGKETTFRFTAGAFFGSGKLIAATGDLTSAITPDLYRTMVGYKGIQASTDENGYAYIDAIVPKVLPYLGIGFGRGVNLKSRVGAAFELGAVYTGGLKITTYDFSHPLEVKTSVITSSDTVDDAGKMLDNGIIDKVSAVPVFPIMKFSIFVRLF